MAALRAGILMLGMAKCLARPVDLESRPLSTLAFFPPWTALAFSHHSGEVPRVSQETGSGSCQFWRPGSRVGIAPLLPYSFIKEFQGQVQVEGRRRPHLGERRVKKGVYSNYLSHCSDQIIAEKQGEGEGISLLASQFSGEPVPPSKESVAALLAVW